MKTNLIIPIAIFLSGCLNCKAQSDSLAFAVVIDPQNTTTQNNYYDIEMRCCKLIKDYLTTHSNLFYLDQIPRHNPGLAVQAFSEDFPAPSKAKMAMRLIFNVDPLPNDHNFMDLRITKVKEVPAPGSSRPGAMQVNFYEKRVRIATCDNDISMVMDTVSEMFKMRNQPYKQVIAICKDKQEHRSFCNPTLFEKVIAYINKADALTRYNWISDCAQAAKYQWVYCIDFDTYREVGGRPGYRLQLLENDAPWDPDDPEKRDVPARKTIVCVDEDAPRELWTTLNVEVQSFCTEAASKTKLTRPKPNPNHIH